MTNHPAEVQLALYAGKDLGFWEQRQVRQHVLGCTRCQAAVHEMEEANVALASLHAELPPDLNWTRLSQEMTGNIRVGLAAGECIAGFERVVRPSRLRLGWHTASLLGGATLVVLAALWLNTPKEQMDHLANAISKVRWERIEAGRGAAPGPDAMVLEASALAIEVKTNTHAFRLMHPQSSGATVSVNMQDSAGVRYVDGDTGQVTLNKVYYAQ